MKVENGFVIGHRWGSNERRTVMVAISAIERIEIDNGNSPAADRIYLRDARAGYIDLVHEDGGQSAALSRDSAERGDVMKTIIEVQMRGDASTLPGGIALKRQDGGAFAVQYFYFQEQGERAYCEGSYDLTLADALEEFLRRVRRAERYQTGGALLPGSVSSIGTYEAEQVPE